MIFCLEFINVSYLFATFICLSFFQKIKLEIGKEYNRASKSSYITSRKKFEFLRAKLSHIRELIQEYDENL